MAATVSAEELRQRRIERARKGGEALRDRYGREHFVAMGRLGGRPTWDQVVDKANAREAATPSKRGRPRSAELKDQLVQHPREGNDPKPARIEK